MLRCILFLIIFIHVRPVKGQTLGGNAVFNFLKQPNTATLSASGGINVSIISNDVGIAFHNPALLRPMHHAQVNASINLLPGAIKNYSLTSAYRVEKYNSNVGFGISYFDYGNIPQTDAAGNELGSFKPNDYVIQVMASTQHKEYWHAGATAKFIHSSYGMYKSSGLAMDVGVTYFDSLKGLQASVVVKNAGFQIKSYNQNLPKEELPFDLQAGISKKLEKAPLQFSLTAHNLHRFNIYYNDTSFLASEGEDSFRDKKFTISKLLTHLVLSTQITIREKIEVLAGYNFLRRKDLNVLNAANGLNGFTIGASLLLKDLQLRYSTGFYQQNMFNQLSVNFGWK